MSSVAPVTPTNSSQLSAEAYVKTVVPVVSGTKDIPPGANGTVIAAVGAGSTYEIAFGPPVSTIETVPQNLLAVA